MVQLYGHVNMERSCRALATVFQPSYFPTDLTLDASRSVEDIRWCETKAYALFSALKRALRRLECFHPLVIDQVWEWMFGKLSEVRRPCVAARKLQDNCAGKSLLLTI